MNHKNPKFQIDVKFNGSLYSMKFELYMDKYPIFCQTFINFVIGENDFY